MTAYTVTSGVTSSGLTISRGDTLVVNSGGTASATTVLAGGSETVSSGGVDAGATISAGGTEAIYGSATGGSIYGSAVVSAATGTSTTASVSNETVYGGGQLNLLATGAAASGTIVNGGSVYVSKSGTLTNTTIENGGTVTLNSAKAILNGTLTFSGSSNQLVISTLNPVQSGSSYGDLATITGFVGSAGDVLDVRVMSGGTLSLTTNGGGNTVATLSGLSGGAAVTEAFILSGGNANYSDLNAVSDGAGGTEIVCFVAGTHIRTDRGDVAIEALSVGDMVVTASGKTRPIKWLGHRTVDCLAHRNRSEVMPIRIARDAFGLGKPEADLFVSPGHAICVTMLDEVLIPAGALVNGSTIAQIDVEHVTYWHVELESHDILLANGLPAESYIDCGNRDFFLAGEGDIDPRVTPATIANYCRPYLSGGALVAVLRSRLRAFALNLGWRLEEAPLGGLHLVADGAVVEPDVEGLTARFVLPASTKTLWLVSDTNMPINIGDSPDGRTLGVFVGELSIDDGLSRRRDVRLDDPLLDVGFHAVEGSTDAPVRWTAGRALLPSTFWSDCHGTFFLRVRLNGPAVPRWVGPKMDLMTMPETPRHELLAVDEAATKPDRPRRRRRAEAPNELTV